MLENDKVNTLKGMNAMKGLELLSSFADAQQAFEDACREGEEYDRSLKRRGGSSRAEAERWAWKILIPGIKIRLRATPARIASKRWKKCLL